MSKFKDWADCSLAGIASSSFVGSGAGILKTSLAPFFIPTAARRSLDGIEDFSLDQFGTYKFSKVFGYPIGLMCLPKVYENLGMLSNPGEDFSLSTLMWGSNLASLAYEIARSYIKYKQ